MPNKDFRLRINPVHELYKNHPIDTTSSYEFVKGKGALFNSLFPASMMLLVGLGSLGGGINISDSSSTSKMLFGILLIGAAIALAIFSVRKHSEKTGPEFSISVEGVRFAQLGQAWLPWSAVANITTLRAGGQHLVTFRINPEGAKLLSQPVDSVRINSSELKCEKMTTPLGMSHTAALECIGAFAEVHCSKLT
jgi:hypothetical protein